jgi:hypothetical protein
MVDVSGTAMCPNGHRLDRDYCVRPDTPHPAVAHPAPRELQQDRDTTNVDSAGFVHTLTGGIMAPERRA